MVELRPRVDWRQTVLLLGRMLGFLRARTGVKHIRLPYNQLNLLYCFNQGSYIHNGSQFRRPAKTKKTEDNESSLCHEKRITTYLHTISQTWA